MAYPALHRLRRHPEFRAAVTMVPGALFILFFLLLPLVSIVIFSFWRTESYTLSPEWNLDNYQVLVSDKA